MRAYAPPAAILVGLLVSATPRLAAQRTTIVTVERARVGACEVVVGLRDALPADAITVDVDNTHLQEQKAGIRGQLTFRVREPLRAGSSIVVQLNGARAAAGVVTGTNDTRPPNCAPPVEESAGAEPALAVTAYFGKSFDQFMPDRPGDYRNPDARVKKSEEVFGFDFDYRLTGGPKSRRRWWIAGETMHGVRTADINCSPEDPAQRPVICDKDVQFTNRARYILANASSLEAFVQPRYEFAELQVGTDAPARLYAHGQLGFVALENSPRVFVKEQVGLGLMVDEGDLAGTYLQAGYGRDDLFSKQYTRVMIDGLLSYNPSLPWKNWFTDLVSEHFRAFAQVTINNDLGKQPDAIRVYMGFDFSPRNLFFP